MRKTYLVEASGDELLHGAQLVIKATSERQAIALAQRHMMRFEGAVGANALVYVVTASQQVQTSLQVAAGQLEMF